jgi:predicted ester cyclase
MRTTFVALVGLCAASLAIGCDEDKKTTETAPSATVPTPSASAASAPPAAPKPSPAEVVTKSIKTAVDAWNSHDASKVAALYEPTAKLVIPGFPDIAGRDGISGETKETLGSYSDFKVVVTRAFIRGNTAAFEWVFTGKNDGPVLGQKPTGRPVGVAGASVVTVDDDGLFKEEHRYFDLPTLQSQLDPKAKAGTFRAPMTLPTAATEWHVAKGTPEETKTIEQGNAIVKAYESHDEKAYLATATDDYTWEDYTSPATIKMADLKATMASYTKAFPDWKLPQAMSLSADGYFVTEMTFTGTQKGPLGPIKASNKPVSMRMLDIQLLKDGKASKEWSYADNAEMLIQVGAMPPIPAGPAGAASGAPSAAPAPSAKPK